MSSPTTFLSRLIGLYSLLVSIAMVMHKQATVDMVTALVRSPTALFASGVVGVGAGLAMVLGHNTWSGGALPVVVTLVGWQTLLKGLLFLFLSPQEAPGFFLEGLRYEQLFYWYAAISFLLGVYLTVSGFRKRARPLT